jgi:hypothetical protein
MIYFGKKWGCFGEKWGRFSSEGILTCCRIHIYTLWYVDFPIINKVLTFCRCITHIPSIIDIKRFALLTFIIPPIMGGQDSKLNFKLLSSLIIPNIEVKLSFL